MLDGAFRKLSRKRWTFKIKLGRKKGKNFNKRKLTAKGIPERKNLFPVRPCKKLAILVRSQSAGLVEGWTGRGLDW
jgi:hypothetical protein